MGTAEGNGLTPLVPIPTKDENKECEMCEVNSSKYTCPRCQMKTCCLSCVKNHKAQRGCSGIRDKTAFVAIKEFTESNLLSDYRLLEDVDRKRYSASGDMKNKPGYLNFRWKTVSKKAAERGVRLRLLPHFFSKHKENSTNFIKKTKLLVWHVKWVFPQSNAEFTDVRLSEDIVLREALHRYLHPDRADPVIRQRLKKYCSKGMADNQVYMKVEDRPANTVRYYIMALDKTIRDNLKGKIVVEYPTFHVVLRDDIDQYQLLQQDTKDYSCVEVKDNSQSLKTKEQEKEDGQAEGPPEEMSSHQTGEGPPEERSSHQTGEGPPEERSSHQTGEGPPEERSSHQTGEAPPEERSSHQVDDAR